MTSVEIRVAVAKTPKFSLSESGDSVEVIERPKGGLTAVVVDGQGHGRAAKRVSQLMVAKALALVADGARDGAVARAVHDHLFALREGKVSAELTLVTVDLHTKSLVVSRNSHCPAIVARNGRSAVSRKATEPIGVHSRMKPAVDEWPLEAGTVVLAFTDGVLAAGQREGRPLDLSEVRRLVARSRPSDVEGLVERVLDLAIRQDHGRPADDMTVVAFGIDDPERAAGGAAAAAPGGVGAAAPCEAPSTVAPSGATPPAPARPPAVPVRRIAIRFPV